MTRSIRKAARWSWTTGEKGLNRVRVFQHPKSGRLFLEWYEAVTGTRPQARTRALGHADREQAKADAEEWALKLRRSEVPRAIDEGASLDLPSLTRPVRLGPLFDIYGREVTPRKTRGDHDRSATAMFVALWERERIVDSLCERDWQRFIGDAGTARSRLRDGQGRAWGTG